MKRLAPATDDFIARQQAAVLSEHELIESYRKSILAALANVESALASSSRTADQELLQEQVLGEARLSLRLAEIRYREGGGAVTIR
jgi:outer membrane protein TolC